jgi:hypothetical protein
MTRKSPTKKRADALVQATKEAVRTSISSITQLGKAIGIELTAISKCETGSDDAASISLSKVYIAKFQSVEIIPVGNGSYEDPKPEPIQSENNSKCRRFEKSKNVTGDVVATETKAKDRKQDPVEVKTSTISFQNASPEAKAVAKLDRARELESILTGGETSLVAYFKSNLELLKLFHQTTASKHHP